MGNNHTFFLDPYFGYMGQDTNQSYINTPNYKSYQVNPLNNSVNWRKGVRNGAFVVDVELYEYGFLAAENVGWVNVKSYKYFIS